MIPLAILTAILALLAPVSDEPGPDWFKEVSGPAGVAYPHTNRSFDNQYAHIMEGYTALGAAVAVGDFNNDGYEDLYVTDSKLDGKNHLYRNNGDFTFTDVAEQAGVAGGNDKANACADALWFDYDNDGDSDLLVIRFGTEILYENQGNGTFADVTEKAGLTQYMNSITGIVFDYDRDGDLDLFVGGYFRDVNVFNPDTPRFFPESFETANNGGGLLVYRNNGDKTFNEVSAEIGFKLSGWTLDLGHADADNDGDDDLYIACDFGTDRFFENLGDGHFADITEKAVGIDTKKGMNVDWGDYDNDGFLDIYVTNITDEYMREGNFLWRNNGNLTFSDVSRETDTYDTGWGWAGKFFDYDHDGWRDLYVVNGWVSAGKENYVLDIFQVIVQPGIDLADARSWPPMGNKTLSGYQRSRLFHNQHGGLFTDQAPTFGLDSLKDGRGIAVADLDNDGRLDLFVANANSTPELFRNEVPQNEKTNWVQFKLKGTLSNRDAVGAQVRITSGGRTQLSFVNGGNGFASQSTLRVHFGLADQSKIDKVEVRWPSGTVQAFEGVAADRVYTVTEGGAIEPMTWEHH